MGDIWEKVYCPNCKAANWICYGDPEDQTKPDTDSCECCLCEHWFWLSEEAAKEVYFSELEDEDDPKTLEQLLPHSLCDRGRRSPDDPYEGTKKKWPKE